MNWIPLINIEEFENIKVASNQIPQIIFKHSTRCSISSTIKNRLERSSIPDQTAFYFLDLIAYREISNKIAEIFNVQHESPQILLIKHGGCVYHESHMAIEMEELKKKLNEISS